MIRATAIGNVITAFRNGVKVRQVMDSTWSDERSFVPHDDGITDAKRLP